MTATSAQVHFAAGGIVRVESNLHLTASTRIDCFTYGAHAPILAIDDAHVKVSLTVPDRDRVTADDVACARRLADAAAEYAAVLGTLAAETGQPEPGAQVAGRAA